MPACADPRGTRPLQRPRSEGGDLNEASFSGGSRRPRFPGGGADERLRAVNGDDQPVGPVYNPF